MQEVGLLLLLCLANKKRYFTVIAFNDGVNLISIAHYRVWWRDFVYTAMKIVSINAENTLTAWVTQIKKKYSLS
jgi:hypothetical protein